MRSTWRISSRSSPSHDVEADKIDHEVPSDTSGDAETGGKQELARTGGDVSWETPWFEFPIARERGAEFTAGNGSAGTEEIGEVTLQIPGVNEDFPLESGAIADTPLCTMFKVIFNFAEFELTGGDALGSGCNFDERGTFVNILFKGKYLDINKIWQEYKSIGNKKALLLV